MSNIIMPIIAAAMNQVSDSQLAIACRNAGILPSISFMNFIDKDTHQINWNAFEDDIKNYNDKTNSKDLIISIGTKTLLFESMREKLVKVFDNISYSHLEIIPMIDLIPLLRLDIQNVNFINTDVEKQYKKQIDSLKEIKQQLSYPIVYWKSLGLKGAMITLQHADFIDGVILKGENGAGTIAKSYGNLEYNIKEIKSKFPTVEVIASGGISTHADIKKYLELGADKVAIGTLFAASEESKISTESKLEYVNRNLQDLTKISGYQSGIVFKELEKDDANNTFSLQAGIESSKKGHLFAGKAIANIKEILPVKEIVQHLWPKN